MSTAWKIIIGVLLAALATFTIGVLSGRIWWFSEEPPLMIIPDMDDQFHLKPQGEARFFADNRAQRYPVEGTLPRQGRSYPFAMGDVDSAEKYFAAGNPLPKTEFVLARGQNRFNTFCSPCHNYTGTGDGLVQRRGFGNQETMNLIRQAAREYSDAKIFHVISAGQNIMPAYADRISETDRWAIVHYVRQLQSKAAAGGLSGASASTANGSTTSKSMQ
ncbi:MAG: cytochrome c [Chlorobiota bacterium]|nr:MAG: cytochrome c [Chlorobiota bacterium]